MERLGRITTSLPDLLIDPAELALAERMYDDDLWSIADELNVTTQVLTDYRAMLNTSRIKERFFINA